eukprot:328395-Chlamydomonas_euryale.AAC.1
MWGHVCRAIELVRLLSLCVQSVQRLPLFPLSSGSPCSHCPAAPPVPTVQRLLWHVACFVGTAHGRRHEACHGVRQAFRPDWSLGPARGHACSVRARMCPPGSARRGLPKVILTTAGFSLAMFNAVAGMLGENLELPEVITSDIWGFTVINISVLSMCAAIYFGITRVLAQSKMI